MTQTAKLLLTFGLVPMLFYFIFFCLLTYPLILSFSSHLFTGTGDGLQNIWNLWWVNRAITQLHQSPWQTTVIYYPQGMFLIGHDLDALNGFLSIFLLTFLTLGQTFNFLLILAFVLTGLTMFWLAYDLTESYAASLLAGFVFTFGNAHFAHAHSGQLEMISLYWIPLFTLCWYRLIRNSAYIWAIAAGLTLFAAALTSFYLLLFCLIIGIVMALWIAIQRRDLLFMFKGKLFKPTVVFILLGLIPFVTLIWPLIQANAQDSLLFDLQHLVTGNEISQQAGLDVFAPLLPGGYWNAKVFLHIPDKLIEGLDERSAYIGLVAFAMLIIAWMNRRRLRNQQIGLWFTILAVFYVLSLGSVLHVAGSAINGLPMPYQLLEKLPGFAVSAHPDRMALMISFGAGLVSAFGFKVIFGLPAKTKIRRRIGIMLIFTVIMAIEYLPVAPSLSEVNAPRYVAILKDLPGQDGVIDTVNYPALSMYYQTIDAKPILFAYTSRVTQRVSLFLDQMQTLIDTKAYDRLCLEYDLRYLIVPISTQISAKMLYQDESVTLYDLACQTKISSEF